VPHPHQAITDPTGQFLLVPDLGADLVRVWSINRETLDLTPTPALVVTPSGSGPRHGVFLKSGQKTFFYLLCELGNTVIVYEVGYKADKALRFTQVYVTGTHGENEIVPKAAAAAEIVLSVSPSIPFRPLRVRRHETDTSASSHARHT
jgi:6-phosphogluconolactonase (cycloisomerase 2 family)